MNDYSATTSSDLDPGRLWAGGAATALIAALVAVAGMLVARGLFRVAVLAPESDGIWGNANTTTYALLAAAAALLATGLIHLLSITTPVPSQFFGWTMALLTLIAVVLPLTIGADLGSRIATAIINLAIGVEVTVLVHVTEASARRVRSRAKRSDAASWNTLPPTGYPGR
ncbi:MAG TPA: DUF6069 family protein [Pseudonocardiaceae bacterium]|jgi:hypothetical protein|nr:DUF6069 family protein [Pseudonocardiaceae bacterium]